MQKDAGCATRAVADVSAVADPSTGVWVYDTYVDPGWEMFGGTSAASPIVASAYALASNSPSSGQTLNRLPYNNSSALNDITSGSNGSCAVTYLCTAGAGYDGPTGLGTPNGTAAFTVASGTPQPKADFSFTASTTSLSSSHGGSSGTDTLNLSSLNSYNSSVRLSISGLKSGVSASFSANPVSPSATSRLSVRAAWWASRGTYPLTITATGSDGTVHALIVQLTVQ